MFFENLITFIILVPIIGIFLILSVPNSEKRLLKILSLNFSLILFVCFLIIWLCFDKMETGFQFTSKFFIFSTLNINFLVGIDGISLFFLLLTTLLVPVCLLASWNSINFLLKEFLVLFLILEFFLICVFLVLDLLFFYVFFESTLIPMFLIIGIWGSRERKILASYYFFLYTLIGSLVMLIGVLYILIEIGTTDYETLLVAPFSNFEQKFLWLTFFLSFASKIPMIPFHLWLPEAHVEAPTPGSVILAGVLLKLGTYGFIRFSLPLFPKASYFFAPLVYSIVSLGIIYASFTAIRQTDFKRIIAYTSIAHMNLVVLGIFSFNIIGLEGALFQSLSHGFVASALFLIIGVVYERYSTRIVKYYGGLGTVMPIYVSIFLFFSLANIGFPGTSSFVGEFFIFLGSFRVNCEITCLAATSMIIGGGYSLWLFNRICYGNLKVQYIYKFIDLSYREFFTFIPLLTGTIVFGVYPNICLMSIHSSVFCLVELLYF
jgi:proton-translocating NADH-quinone oxidoreductase chain M